MTPDGVVRALVGGRNYGESQFNRAIDAKRQPGSAFKPFVYLTALEHGLTPDSVREDAPISVKGWKPENFEREYPGPVTLTQALANSLNTVSVRLTLEFGPEAVVRTAYRLGITSISSPMPRSRSAPRKCRRSNWSRPIRPLPMAGSAVTPHVVERIRTADGKTLYDRAEPAARPHRRRPLCRHDEHDDARDAGVRAPRAAPSLPGWTAAGKTGTSQDFRDAWFIGYTSHLVTGVWLGNDDNSPTKKAVGGGLPVEIWSRFMRAAHQGVTPTPLPGLGSSWFNPAPPSAAVPAAAAGDRNNPQPSSGGLDFWLLDKLFGRR